MSIFYGALEWKGGDPSSEAAIAALNALTPVRCPSSVKYTNEKVKKGQKGLGKKLFRQKKTTK